jgi:hypothetical protein
MRTFIAAVIIALLTVPSFAQGMPGSKGHHGRAQSTEQPKKKADDKAYKSALDRLPDKKFDPWQNVRETPQPK